MSSSSTEKYDVFLSFRGEDTRRGFTIHLFQALGKKAIKTYMDCLLERGEEVGPALAKAIDNSQVSIVIFSENYATSKWCLEELVRILERRKDQGQVVIPVFYYTDPSDIRKQTGTYGKAFAKYEGDLANNDHEFTRQKIISWKDALTEGANISGWDSRTYRDEDLLIENIVNDVSQKRNLRRSIELKGLVGTEEICRKVELYMNNNVRVLGIWGMPGIGKTTIAKVLFAKLFPQFDNVCFVANVKEYSLDRLLSELLKEVVTGITFDMARLGSKKVFIVLDDVNSVDQLYLCREFRGLSQESRLIITTRNKQLLEKRVDFIYKVEKWNNPESLRLFSLEAFEKTHPLGVYKDLATKAVEYAGGVPLALKVLGSYLRSKRILFWESTLRKLDKYPNEGIQNVLKVSYDGLDDLEKKIFLDIAFFFNGEKKDRVVSILDACGFEASSGIEVLEDKALITISYSNVIEMHDLLQKMAFQIEREESSRNLEGRSRRVRDIEEVGVVLKDNKGTDAVEGIILDLSQIKDWHLRADTFQKMNNLRFLKFYISLGQRSGCMYLPTTLEPFSDKLRYLEWNGYPLEFLPPTFCAKLLVEIRMPHSHVKKLWQGIQELDNLEEIDLSGSKQLEELPDLSKASRLKWVNLCGCESMSVLHSSVLSSNTLVTLILDGCTNLSCVKGDKHLKSLQNISVNGCSSLKEFAVSSDSIENLDLSKTGIATLDKSIGLLYNLRRLNLEGLALKHLPEELSSLTSLMELKLSSRELVIGKDQLRDLFSGLRSLQILHLKECKNLFELPDNIGALSKLQDLRLDGSSVKSLPTSIKHLQELEILSLQSCTRLESLPELPQFIKKFDAQNCTSLKSVPNLKTFATKMVGKVKRVSFENSLKLDGHSLHSIMESLHLTMVSAAFHNRLVRNYGVNVHSYNYNSVEICIPGSRVPRQFKPQTNKSSSITVQLPMSSNLLGIIYYVVLSPSHGIKKRGAKIQCQCHLEEGTKVTWLDKAISELNSNHVYIWYDPFQCDTIRKLNEPKVHFEFSVITDRGEVDASISILECGVHLISVSELDSVLTELDSDKKKELEKEFESDFRRSITRMSKQLHPHASEDHSEVRIPSPPPPTEMKKGSSGEKESNVMRNEVPNQQRGLNEQTSYSCKLEESKPVTVETDVRSSGHFSDVEKSMESASNETMTDAGRGRRENNKGCNQITGLKTHNHSPGVTLIPEGHDEATKEVPKHPFSPLVAPRGHNQRDSHLNYSSIQTPAVGLVTFNQPLVEGVTFQESTLGKGLLVSEDIPDQTSAAKASEDQGVIEGDEGSTPHQKRGKAIAQEALTQEEESVLSLKEGAAMSSTNGPPPLTMKRSDGSASSSLSEAFIGGMITSSGNSRLQTEANLIDRSGTMSVLPEVQVELTKLPLTPEVSTILGPFLTKHPCMRLTTHVRHRGSAYAFLGEFLLLLREHSLSALSGEKKEEFQDFLDGLSCYSFEQLWLDNLKSQVISPPKDSPLRSLEVNLELQDELKVKRERASEELAHLRHLIKDREQEIENFDAELVHLKGEESRLRSLLSAPFLSTLM